MKLSIQTTSPTTQVQDLEPLRSRWIADPMAIDGGFQMMILWSFQQRGQGSLPTEVGEYRQFRGTFPEHGVRIEVRVTDHSDGRAIADVDWLADDGALVARMSDYQCVVDESLAQAFRRNTLETRNAARR